MHICFKVRLPVWILFFISGRIWLQAEMLYIDGKMVADMEVLINQGDSVKKAYSIENKR